MRPGFVIMPLPEAAEAGSDVLGGLRGIWWLGLRRSGVWPGFAVLALAEGIEAGGKPVAVSGTSVGRPCFVRVGHFVCFGENHPVAVLWESGVPVLPLGPRSPPEPSGRSREMGAGQMKPVGQDADMQKAAFRVERPPCKVFPGSAGPDQSSQSGIRSRPIRSSIDWRGRTMAKSSPLTRTSGVRARVL